ncbi:MAG: glycosyltransferase family 4 protein [Candidatus Thalassarchaeaceae archaeon]|nr:glycosyltransferase family 4 protein [Candidatus Thalassarchaeaceae archaeon]MDP7043871.1 glycosyltransferase family 4 protein [Candidatus Thalassarchaeaceae archaeon]
MKSVLHIGPVRSKGGMQATIHHHLKHPPKGWETASVNTHVDGSVFAKINAWRQAKKELSHRLKNDPPDVVHIHTATKYSWWRKLRAVKMCITANIPIILQVHAGNFHFFLQNKPSVAKEFSRIVSHPLVTPVALTPRHKKEIGLSEMAVIGSPAPPTKQIDSSTRDRNMLILLARPSPIKGHRLAIAAVQNLRERGYLVNLHLSGISPSHQWVRQLGPDEGIHARGWLSGEEKNELLENAGLLLIPSTFEGMPVSAMEALSCGLPVVASPACDGILGDAGIIVEQLDSDAWVDAIAEILNDEEKWRQLSLAGPEAVAQQTPEALGKQWADLYEKSLKGVSN